MSGDNDNGRKSRAGRDQGPQGTQVFSREEVDQLIGDAATADEPATRAELAGYSAAVSGQSFPLPSTRVIVGRAESCDVRVADASVSSEHARMVCDTGGWRVINLLSTNGTFINDRKISNAPLKHGDRIRFGRVEFTFHAPDQAGEPAAGDGRWKRWLAWVALAGVVAVAAALVWLM